MSNAQPASRADGIPIKANGGISSGRTMSSPCMRAGATCVDLYSAFVYQGWDVARRINLELADLLRSQQHRPQRESRGAGKAAPVGVAR